MRGPTQAQVEDLGYALGRDVEPCELSFCAQECGVDGYEEIEVYPAAGAYEEPAAEDLALLAALGEA